MPDFKKFNKYYKPLLMEYDIGYSTCKDEFPVIDIGDVIIIIHKDTLVRVKVVTIIGDNVYWEDDDEFSFTSFKSLTFKDDNIILIIS